MIILSPKSEQKVTMVEVVLVVVRGKTYYTHNNSQIWHLRAEKNRVFWVCRMLVRINIGSFGNGIISEGTFRSPVSYWPRELECADSGSKVILYGLLQESAITYNCQLDGQNGFSWWSCFGTLKGERKAFENPFHQPMLHSGISLNPSTMPRLTIFFEKQPIYFLLSNPPLTRSSLFLAQSVDETISRTFSKQP